MTLLDLKRWSELRAEMEIDLGTEKTARPKLSGKATSDQQIRLQYAMIVARDVFIFLANPSNYELLSSLLETTRAIKKFAKTTLDTRFVAQTSQSVALAFAFAKDADANKRSFESARMQNDKVQEEMRTLYCKSYRVPDRRPLRVQHAVPAHDFKSIEKAYLQDTERNGMCSAVRAQLHAFARSVHWS